MVLHVDLPFYEWSPATGLVTGEFINRTKSVALAFRQALDMRQYLPGHIGEGGIITADASRFVWGYKAPDIARSKSAAIISEAF